MMDSNDYRRQRDRVNPADGPARTEPEFPFSAAGPADAVSRRQFLQLMGASIALAGATGCRWPEANIVPFNGRPEGYFPGASVQFATSMETGGVAAGLLATSVDGRPIKIEGNPLHPTNQGATNAFQQASVLGLYDPDRSQWVMRGNTTPAGGNPPATQNAPLATSQPRSSNSQLLWGDFAAENQDLFTRLRQQKGEGLYFLSEATSSPTVERLRKRLAQACPKHQWLEYEPISWDNEREGTRLVLGQPCRVDFNLDQADIIVSLDADFLWGHPAGVKYARDFASRRRADDGRMNRLYAFESLLSVTGSMADYRLTLRSAIVIDVAVAMANQMGLGEGLDMVLSRLVTSERFKVVLPQLPPWFEGMMRDLQDHRGKCALVVGPRQPAVLHALACVMNAALGNVGQTVLYRPDLYPDRSTHAQSIVQLADAIKAGQVKTLVILGENPAYAAPGELDLGNLLDKVPTTVHLGLYQDETGRRCTWHLPQAHYLESWADSRAWDGTISLTQPLIEPLYRGRTTAELLAFILSEPAKARDLVRQTLQERKPAGDFEAYWQSVLHDGVVSDTAFAPIAANPKPKPLAEKITAFFQGHGISARGQTNFELVLCPSASTYDGRYANNAWLQELPDNLTKLAWDNALLIAPVHAGKLGLKNGDEVRVQLDKQSVTLPVFVLPGQAAGSLTAALGYGRTHCGHVGEAVGTDLYPLLRKDGQLVLPEVRIEKTGKKYQLASTQMQFPIGSLGGQETQRRSRQLVRTAELSEYQADPGFARTEADHQLEKSSQLFKGHDYKGYKWGMMIDLSACIGCSACETACMAENNIPVVGKDEVARGRIMHWIRIDRYFEGDPHQPQVAFQPVPCMQCENAPCETVCPVGATMHDLEGLNAMSYNRCIGTRYCSNNCPFKVRRFNWFWNQKNPDGRPLTDVQKMVYNPSVTLRSRGVMEKCTYCVQRISQAKIEAKNRAVSELKARQMTGEVAADAALPEKIPLPDGTIIPACAQACPTRAITFGDLNDPEARVSILHHTPRQYGILTELNVRARTNYLARLKNRGDSAEIGRRNEKIHE